MTGTGLQIGIALPQTGDIGVELAQLRDYLALVDKAGYDSLWVTEQLFGPAARFDPLSVLAYAAALTSRVRLGTAILLGALHNPVLLAKAIASLDHMSNGRISLGLGLSGDKSIYPALGLRSEERGKRLDAGIDLMVRLWRDELVTDRNDFWQIEDVRMEPKPIQRPHPPLLFGGSAPAALRRAARVGQGWIGAGAASTARASEEMRMLRGFVSESCASPDTFTYGKRVYLAIDEDREAALGRLRSWYARTYSPRPAENVDGVAIYGPVGYCTERLLELVDAGFNLLILNPVFEELKHAEHMALNLVPALRKS